jgi:hypothetical protein
VRTSEPASVMATMFHPPRPGGKASGESAVAVTAAQ